MTRGAPRPSSRRRGTAMASISSSGSPSAGGRLPRRWPRSSPATGTRWASGPRSSSSSGRSTTSGRPDRSSGTPSTTRSSTAPGTPPTPCSASSRTSRPSAISTPRAISSRRSETTSRRSIPSDGASWPRRLSRGCTRRRCGSSSGSSSCSRACRRRSRPSGSAPTTSSGPATPTWRPEALPFLLRRLGQAGIVAFGVSVLVFALVHLSGDPVLLMVSSDAPPDVVDTTRRALGFDRPLYQQLAQYLVRAAQGDLGVSLRSQRPLAALLLAVVTAVPLGIVSAVKRGSPVDRLAMMGAVAGQAMPIFWLALLLIALFGVRLRWLPVFGRGSLAHLVLPALSLSTIILGRLARLVRSSMLEVLGQDYVRTARAKGLAEPRVLALHALRNAAIPIVTLLGLQFAQLLGGAVVTETIFAWPGVGRLVVEAIFNRDFPVVQGVVLVVSLIFVAVNVLVDLTYAVLDPRIRTEAA